MLVRSLLILASVLAAAPVFAAEADAGAAQNATNWEIFQKLYPRRAMAAREEGAVGFKVTIDAKGTVTECQVTHSSGHSLLDQETCTLITLNAEFKPEAGLSGSQVRTREGVIAWKLPDSTTQLTAPKAVAMNNAPEKVICKKSIRTGTIGGVERTCMTRRDWARQTDELKQPWEELQGRKGVTNGR